MKFPRRYVLLLAIGGFALFFGSQAARVDVPPGEALHTVEGTVAEVVIRSENGEHEGRRIKVRRSLAYLHEHRNVEFLLERQPHDGLAAGSKVIIETRDDIAQRFDAAARFPDTMQRIEATGLVDDGVDVYTTAEAHDRASASQWRWRIAAVVCWAVFLTWAALAGRKHWPAVRRKVDELLN